MFFSGCCAIGICANELKSARNAKDKSDLSFVIVGGWSICRPRICVFLFNRKINWMCHVLSFKVAIYCLRRVDRPRAVTCFCVGFLVGNCLEGQKIHIERRNYAQRVDNRRPLHFL